MLETYQKMISIIGIIIISIILFKFVSSILFSIMFFIIGIGLITYFETTELGLDENSIIKTHTTDNVEHNIKHINVWTYWEGKPSKLVDICLKRISQSCENGSNNHIIYTHTHLTRKNIENYIQPGSYMCYSSGSPALRSDIIRLLLLLKYGGIWLDATILVFKNMDEIFPDNDVMCFQAFYNSINIKDNDDGFVVVETSTMSTPKNNPLIKKWLDEMNLLSTCNKYDRIKYANNLDINTFNLCKSYHFAYFAFLGMLKKNGGIQAFPNVKLYSILNYKYFCYLSYDKIDFLKLSYIELVNKYGKYSMVKFISNERKYIDKHINNANLDCVLYNFK